jgi:D-alanyl-D-alanine carboxypeptidase (penicillin-binding protein 5/6)
MKKIIIVLIVLLLSISLSPNYSIAISADSAIVMEKESGRVLFKKDAFMQKRIASITKIMTAIIAIESGKMDETVRVSEKAAFTEGSSIYLKPGDQIKLKDLVYGLMLRSGNDAAVAIAEHIGGSLEGFVFLMNQKTKEFGMLDTVFSNPHGLDDHEKHYSTAYDMALLTRYALNNDTFAEIIATKAYRPSLENEKDVVWINKNKMLKKYKYSTGGKTGYTRRAKRTLVSTAKKDGMELIAVTLNAPDDWNDHIKMFNDNFNKFKLYKLIEKGTIDFVHHVFYEGHAVLKRDFFYPLTKQERNEIKFKVNMEKPKKEELEKGNIDSPVGKLHILHQGDTIKKLPIYYE